MLERWIADKLKQTMRYTPVVALLGPRQVGKTALAQAVSKNRSTLYLDLENPEDLLKLSDPFAFLSLHGDKLVIMDERQCSLDLFMDQLYRTVRPEHAGSALYYAGRHSEIRLPIAFGI